MARLGRGQPFKPLVQKRKFALASIALSGTITSTTVQADIRAGGKTIILTLTGDSWIGVPYTYASFATAYTTYNDSAHLTYGTIGDDQRQNIITGMDSAQSEALGWDAVVKALQGVAGVVRTSDKVVTITLDAQATYTITAQETITVTVPASALVLGLAVVASPTFTVDTAAATDIIPLYMLINGMGNQYYGLRV